MADEEYQNETMDAFDCQDNLFTQETYEKIMSEKKGEPNKYHSHWECDEEDIQSWTQEEISKDPGKQLLTYSENGNFEEIKSLLERNTDCLSYKDQDGYTALHRAAYSNKLEICMYLLNKLPSLINSRTDMGWTPLHSASYWNNYEIVNYFLNTQHIKIVNSLTNSNQSSLHLAASQRNCKETLILLLLNKFINYNKINDSNELASDIATRSCEFYRLFEITDSNLTQINY